MRRFIITVILCLSALESVAEQKILTVLPYPSEAVLGEGSFNISGAVVNYAAGLDEASLAVVKTFSTRLGVIPASVSEEAVSGINFLLDNSISDESYTLDVSPQKVVVKASSREGFFYAVQTIRQLLPAEIYGTSAVQSDWTIPCLTISDTPRFSYRGMHLDVSRHFFSVDQVKKYIDILSIYKINRFHWHLTDDQGWRIEIKKYPNLTEIGSKREGTQIEKDFNRHDSIPYGGYYTQEQIKDIVKYADERCITIIPEIDLPGHMMGALAAYPELGCTGGPYKVWTQWGISSQVICPAKEDAMTFLKDVLDEVAELFPSEYIHIGGDECPVTEWKTNAECQELITKLGYVDEGKVTAERKLQFYVAKTLQDYMASKGRKVIVWQEVLAGIGGVNSDADVIPGFSKEDFSSKGGVLMSWTSKSAGIKAARKGIDVVMAPSFACYFDCRQSDLTSEPLSSGSNGNRAVTVANCYDMDPSEGIPADMQHHVLGAQGALWTEYIPTPEHLEYMLLPRLAALSEVNWTELENKDMGRLKTVLRTKHFGIYDALDFRYRAVIDF